MKDQEELEIPDSDELPDDEEELADDEPHGHLHTPGYPEHLHTGHGIAYEASQVNQAGGLALFPEERHDGDSDQAQTLRDELDSLDALTPLMDAFIEAAGGLGYDLADGPRRWVLSAEKKGMFGLGGKYGLITITIEYTG